MKESFYIKLYHNGILISVIFSSTHLAGPCGGTRGFMEYERGDCQSHDYGHKSLRISALCGRKEAEKRSRTRGDGFHRRLKQESVDGDRESLVIFPL